MPARKTLEDYRDLALARGFTWLGPEVGGVDIKTSWQCPQGHSWDARYHNIKQGKGCPHCANKFPKVPQDYHDLASARGFVWLGPEVATVMDKTLWQCTLGHQWQARYNNIQQCDSCPYCSGKSPKVPQDYHDLAKARGFAWLGPKVKSVLFKTQWQCNRGHQWKAIYNSVQQGKGCPRCSKQISKPEIQLREAINFVYPDTQGNARKLLETWRFELDIYVPSLRKAVEYDGWAHTYYLKSVARDARKDEECIKAGIKLLRVKDKDYKANPEATTQKVLEWLANNT